MARTTQKSAVKKRRGAQPRRRQRASRNWLRVVRLLLSLSVVAFLLGGLVKLMLSVGDVSVERVAFAGNVKHASRERLVERVNPFLDAGYLSLELDEIKRSVEKEAWVFSANVERTWPWALTVRIEEQTPIAYWGSEALINFRGEIFIPENMPKDLALPILRGPNKASVEVLQAYQLMAEMLSATPLVLAHLTLDSDGQWVAVLADHVEIRLGRKQPVQNMKRFLLVYHQKLREQFANVQQIDTRYINGVAVDWKGVSS